MKISIPQLANRSLIVAGVLVTLLIVFLAGTRRQVHQLAALGPLEERLRQQVGERAKEIAAWEPASEAELALQTSIHQRCLAAVPVASEARLRAAGEIAGRAELCGMRDVTIEEIDSGDDFDREEDDEENAGAASIEGLRIGDDQEDVSLERFAFAMDCRCDFDELSAFLTDLGRNGVLIELRSLKIERDAPLLRVSMEFAAYGRGAA